MGTVFEAAHSALARTVAIKVMHPSLAAEREQVHRFHQEAIAGGRFSHANSIGIFDYDRTPAGHPFLVMELVRGPNLVQFAFERGPLSLEQIVDLVEQLLWALDAAHSAGVVHGDVKSDNVVVQSGEHEPTIKLLDFGLAIVDGAPSAYERRTNPSLIAGTPDYMAPEVIGGRCPTFASDLYAVGIVLYELLTESRPFTAQPYQEMLQQHLHQAVVAPSKSRPDRRIPPALDQVVLCALAKSPTERFSSAGTFAHALRRALGGSATASRPSRLEVATTTAMRPLARSTSHPPLAVSTPALRQQIAVALRRGVIEDIARAYLELAASLTERGCYSTAAMELAEGIDIVTAGAPSSVQCVEQLRSELQVVRDLASRDNEMMKHHHER